MKKEEFVKLLNNNENNFKMDTENINNGYPVLNKKETISITFNDKVFYDKILDRLLGKIETYDYDTKTIEITQEDIDSVTILELNNYKIDDIDMIQDISGIEYFTNITKLNLAFNNIKDISKIENLKKLEELNLSANKILNINSIVELSELKKLILNYNDITDIPLLTCTQLTYLDLRANRITDISKISNLNKLETLQLGNYTYSGIETDRANAIMDISVLENLTNLTNVSVTGQKLTTSGDAGSEISLPNIFIQAKDINSIGYTENNLILNNCSLNDDGTKVILSDDVNKVAKITISGGILSMSTLSINIENVVKTLAGIKVTKVPSKLSYIEGQNFDKTGMVVIATYNDGSANEITDYTIVDGNSLTAGQTSVTIRYEENDITKTITQGITVIKKLEISLETYKEKQEGTVKYIENISTGTTIRNALEKVKTNGKVEIYKGTTKVTDLDAKMATGMELEISLDNEKVKYVIVVTGDVNGDGKISTTDITKIKKHIIQREKLQGCYERAADIQKDEKISVTDLAKVKKALVGLITL